MLRVNLCIGFPPGEGDSSKVKLRKTYCKYVLKSYLRTGSVPDYLFKDVLQARVEEIAFQKDLRRNQVFLSINQPLPGFIFHR